MLCCSMLVVGESAEHYFLPCLEHVRVAVPLARPPLPVAVAAVVLAGVRAVVPRMRAPVAVRVLDVPVQVALRVVRFVAAGAVAVEVFRARFVVRLFVLLEFMLRVRLCTVAVLGLRLALDLHPALVAHERARVLGHDDELVVK